MDRCHTFEPMRITDISLDSYLGHDPGVTMSRLQDDLIVGKWVKIGRNSFELIQYYGDFTPLYVFAIFSMVDA